MALRSELAPVSRRCGRTGRDLVPGEVVHSTLVEGAGRWRRIDVAAEAWTGPPDGALGCWRTRVPNREGRRRLNGEVMLDLLAATAAAADDRQLRLRYVLGLLLVRHRLLRLETSESPDWLLLREQTDPRLHRVRKMTLSEAEQQDVEAELHRLLT